MSSTVLQVVVSLWAFTLMVQPFFYTEVEYLGMRNEVIHTEDVPTSSCSG
jgi:hypothetical protein